MQARQRDCIINSVVGSGTIEIDITCVLSNIQPIKNTLNYNSVTLRGDKNRTDDVGVNNQNEPHIKLQLQAGLTLSTVS